MLFSASAIAAAPLSPMSLPRRCSVVSAVLLFSASAIAVAPLSPMALLLKSSWRHVCACRGKLFSYLARCKSVQLCVTNTTCTPLYTTYERTFARAVLTASASASASACCDHAWGFLFGVVGWLAMHVGGWVKHGSQRKLNECIHEIIAVRCPPAPMLHRCDGLLPHPVKLVRECLKASAG